MTDDALEVVAQLFVAGVPVTAQAVASGEDDRRATRARLTVTGMAIRRRVVELRLNEMHRRHRRRGADDYIDRTRLVARAFASYV